MIFIKKIFDNAIDEDVHKQFTRFSKGEFPNRAMMKITISKDSFKMYMSYDLIKDIASLIAQNIEKAEVTGKTIKGKKKTETTASMTGEELKKICKENDFVLLDINAPGYTLKCKKSLPKPGKGLDDKFASATLPLNLLSEFIEGEKFKQI